MKKLWLAFSGVILLSFAVLGWVGSRIYQEAPPIPKLTVTSNGESFLSGSDIENGQNVWQAMGGMESGSIWGHGSYVAPDWTADWLHRESLYILNVWSQNDYHQNYDALNNEQKAALDSRLKTLLRTNTYNPKDQTLTIDPVRKEAFLNNLQHYTQVFSEGNKDYAIAKNAQSDPQKLKELCAFFFWSAWAATANRIGDNVSYTQNWPHEPLVGNRPTGETVVWTGVSIIMLLAGICAMVWYYASLPKPQGESHYPEKDPLLDAEATPSQKATVKYFVVVSLLILLQIICGVITAHYGVEGNGFYGFDLARWLPYVVTRTWHVQLGLFWIATAWLAAGLMIAPVIGGAEPRGQVWGVNILFGALLVIVLGSLAGEWLSVMHKLTGNNWFYFGHQGYEYVDLGRAWQIGLLLGLFIWLGLVLRGVWPALKRSDNQKQLLILFLVAAAAIGGFYGAGLMWGQHTPLTIVEYWRWWVVHLWVEGFFEVFATVVIAFLFSKLNLVNPSTAAKASLLSGTIYLSGGIIGTLHHLYWAGTPSVALAFGSVFSALEVVPLVLVGYSAWEDIRLSKAVEWVKVYRWPIYFFVAVAFWNMVGAGLFGFMINPPIALYYMQGLNTTPVHAHAALFGVYGMLGIGLMLFCLRVLNPRAVWREGLLKFSFWALNIGLGIMVLFSLLPVGLMQTWASVEYGYWYARSAEFLQTPVLNVLRWMRVPGDSIFALGAFALVAFVLMQACFRKSE